uniref:Alpha-mannosidase n=1 Tax=Strigamia maritima TaxID=126957 RepID=T1JDE6_STRMM
MTGGCERIYRLDQFLFDKLVIRYPTFQVFVIPHSHNDPGWLKTFESYFEAQTSNILNNMVEKLIKLPNMTFMWTEMSLFSKWWERAHAQKKSAVKELLQSGRFEIITGGWVMTDEANPHIYAMLDQLIEGHQWLANTLDYSPRTAWSVDPFGHGATLPYLLSQSGIEGMVIQRIHFAWKQYLAEQQSGDFLWRQTWDNAGSSDILCHNNPFDIYSIKHSCGPHPMVCLTFDFRKIKGEFTEYSQKAQPITKWNVKERAETLLAQYGRTASLFPHNVALISLGDDFRFDHESEWNQQYINYQQLFEYINSHNEYRASVQFGTVSDYFREVQNRMGGAGHEAEYFPKLSGDFFVYSDIFVEGRPAYWSGFYTTRPYWKALCRELEATLRSAEILYSFALSKARQSELNRTRQILEGDYHKLTVARGNLGVFQHHDAITGTSKSFVMHDYGLKLYEGIRHAHTVMTHAAQYLITEKPLEAEIQTEKLFKHLPNFLSSPHERSNYQMLLQPLPQKSADFKLIVYNSLAQARQEAIRVVVTHTNIRIFDSEDKSVPFQLNPVWNTTAGPFQLVRDQYELLFIAQLPPLTLVTYHVKRVQVRDSSTIASLMVFNGGLGMDDTNMVFSVQKEQMASDDVYLENSVLKADFARETGFLNSITLKANGRTQSTKLDFLAYNSAQSHSGAYLFMPEPRSPVRNISEIPPYFCVLRGPLISEIIVQYMNLLVHTVRIYHTNGPLSMGLEMDNIIEYPTPPKFRETEVFMRVLSDVASGSTFFTDLNGFQMMKRSIIPKIEIEGNYYPATTQIYIQDDNTRLSLLLSRAHGVTSWQKGWLEAMLDRRSLYDDSRGMGEGVIDNKRTRGRFWLLLEERAGKSESFSRPTLLANTLSNSLIYPAHTLVVDPGNSPVLRNKVSLLNRPFPCDMHLVNLRVLPVKAYFEFPSFSSLLIVQRQGYSCDFSAQMYNCSLTNGVIRPGTRFKEVQMSAIFRTSLTALELGDKLDSLSDINIQPMEINSYNITFG